MRLASILVGLAALALAPHAHAQATVTDRLASPYVPEGYLLEKTEDCRIQSSGGAPDAHLRCAPGYGWRILSARGAVIYPESGYLRPDVEWSFAGDEGVVFKSGRDLTLVHLPSGEAEELGEGSLEQLRNVEGIDFTGVVWFASADPTQPVEARPLLTSGEIGPAISGSDMRGLVRMYDLPCWRPGVLAAIKVETLPNTVWKRIVRLPGEGRTNCDAVRFDALAGLGADDRWHALSNETLRARVERTFDTPEEALAWP